MIRPPVGLLVALGFIGLSVPIVSPATAVTCEGEKHQNFLSGRCSEEIESTTSSSSGGRPRNKTNVAYVKEAGDAFFSPCLNNGRTGAWAFVSVLAPDGDIVVAATRQCVIPPDGGPPAPPALPPIPTPERVAAESPFPDVAVNYNPRVRGLVGFETWLWAEPAALAPIALVVDGAAVVVSARPVEYRWVLGDGAEVTSTEPGSEADPAGTHVYTQMGHYDVVLEVTWEGQYSAIGPGGAVTVPLGQVTRSVTRPYVVWEAQAVVRR